MSKTRRNNPRRREARVRVRKAAPPPAPPSASPPRPRRALMVSSYPPKPCGIGSYAEQQVAALRAEGRVVDVFALPGGDGDYVGELRGGFRPLALARRLWAYDEAILQFTPGFFYDDGSGLNRLATAFALWLLAFLFRRKLRFVVHETDYNVEAPGRGRSPRKWLERGVWKRCGGVEFHSRRELEAFAAHYGLRADDPRYAVVAHDRHFRPYSALTRGQARARLGVEPGKIVFLCLGFIQPHKGFDRALRAMRAVRSPDARLYIVGSVRINWEPAIECARELHAEARRDPRCRVIETYVDNESFDAWIAASDYVVIPYRFIWSSSIAARARLLGRPMIASAAGGLPEQATEGSVTFQTDEELGEIMNRLSRSNATQ